MNYLVAVSGGVDSVVLLDMLAQEAGVRGKASDTITVAHVDHGIREDSASWARQPVSNKRGMRGMSFYLHRQKNTRQLS